MIDLSASSGDLSPINLPDVFAKRPLLQSIFEKFYNKSLSFWAGENLKNLPLPETSRRKEFLACIREMLTERLGADVAEGVIKQLQKYYAGSTADHHGTMNSSLAISSNLLMASGFREINDPILKYLIVFSCASVSLNNEDWPLGISFHTEEKGDFSLKRVAIIPRKNDSAIVYGFRPYKKEELKNAQKVLRERAAEGDGYTPESAEHIIKILDALFGKEEILSAPDLCTQFTRINFALWKMIFPESVGVSDMVYIESEEIVTRLILKHHLSEKSPIYQFMFDAEWDDMRESLSQIMEKYLRQKSLPTYLFWGISDSHKRVKLVKVGDNLESEDEKIRIPLHPQYLREALREKKIMPNLLMVFLTLHLYYGMNCFGGFNQIHYLDAMKQFYREKNKDKNAPNPNSTLYQYGLDLLHFRDKNGIFFHSPSGVDFLLHGRLSWDEYLKEIEKITFGEAFQSSARIIQSLTE